MQHVCYSGPSALAADYRIFALANNRACILVKHETRFQLSITSSLITAKTSLRA